MNVQSVCYPGLLSNYPLLPSLPLTNPRGPFPRVVMATERPVCAIFVALLAAKAARLFQSLSRSASEAVCKLESL